MTDWKQRVRNYHPEAPDEAEVFIAGAEREVATYSLTLQLFEFRDYLGTRDKLERLGMLLHKVEQCMATIDTDNRELLSIWVSVPTTSTPDLARQQFSNLDSQIQKWRQALEVINSRLKEGGRLKGINNPRTYPQRVFARDIIFLYQESFQLPSPPAIRQRTFSAIFKELLLVAEIDLAKPSDLYWQALETPVI